MLIWTANIINLLNLTPGGDNALVSDRVHIFDTTLRDGEQSPVPGELLSLDALEERAEVPRPEAAVAVALDIS